MDEIANLAAAFATIYHEEAQDTTVDRDDRLRAEGKAEAYENVRRWISPTKEEEAEYEREVQTLIRRIIP